MDVQLLAALESPILDRLAGGLEDQVDQDVAVEGLVEPTLRRLLGPQSGGREDLQAALRVRLPQHQVDVVHRLGAASRPHREPAAEQERHLGVAQEARDLLQRLEQLVEGRFVLRHA